MKFDWVQLLTSLAVTVVALVVYDKWIKSKVTV